METFIVRVRATRPGEQRLELSGVATHVASDRSSPFRTAEELLGFLRDCISTPHDGDETASPRPREEGSE